MNSKHQNLPTQVNVKSNSGFTLISVLVLVSVLVLLIAIVGVSLSISQRTASTERDVNAARKSALFGLSTALGELQAAAGPDQRITATGSILGDPANAYTNEVVAVEGQEAWAGIWKSSTIATETEEAAYSPAEPDVKEFVGWLVSRTDDQGNFKIPTDLSEIATDVSTIPDSQGGLKNHIVLATKSDGTPHIQVEKVLINEMQRGKRYFAFSVEDESTKADLAWNEMSTESVGEERAQQMRLSGVPGPDYTSLTGPNNNSPIGQMEHTVSHPISIEDESGNQFLNNSVTLMRDPTDLKTFLSDIDSVSDWLDDMRGDITWGSRGVLSDVKKGGLRRDLSLAFEMDGTAESLDAELFNSQDTEFVGNDDQQSSPFVTEGLSLKARHLFRDFGVSDINPNGAGDIFSNDITQPETVVRGPSWWLLRDYANLYKRLSSSATGEHSINARAYFPNRTTATSSGFLEDLNDIHADNQWQNFRFGAIKVSPTNRETNVAKTNYAYRPAQANYAPVILGINAIYSLIYEGNNLKMTVDPFFILWNPYNTAITAEKFALTLENGFAGGMRFRHTDGDGKQRLYGRPSQWGNGRGSDTSFFDFAKHKSGTNAHLSYLISGLSMKPGEILIYSPPNEDDRSDQATVLNDELFPGISYNATTSGIFFDEFPEYNSSSQFIGWKPVVLDNESGPHTIDVLFNVASQSGQAIVNIIETNIPRSNIQPNELTTEESFGDHIAAQEYRLNFGGGEHSTNIDTGQRGFSLSYSLSELGSTKKAFGLLSMLTIPTDYAEADTAMEVFSQLNATPVVRSQLERFGRGPLNIVVKSVPADGINNLMNEVGIDIDAFGDGSNGFYGKDYSLTEGDTIFPLLDIPKAPLHSLIQFSGANLGTRLFEPTHPIGNSWKPPYIPEGSIYHNSSAYVLGWYELTMNDVSWQMNDALFDRYFLSGLAPDYSIEQSGYTQEPNASLNQTLANFYSSDYATAKANPVLLPYIPKGKSTTEIVDEITPSNADASGYKKLGAYSFIKGAFNINSTSIASWSAFLKGNKGLAIETIQGNTEDSTGSPFPLNTSPSDAESNNGWEKFSRISDEQIWDDQETPDDTSDDTGLAVEIVKQIKARGPFMSLSDFVNRRVSSSSNNNHALQGAIQAAIEEAEINGDQSSGIRSQTSETVPNYNNFASVFPHAPAETIGSRNNATGVPLEINQANVLLPIAPRLTARSDTFRIRAYGEVRDQEESRILSRATCEVVVQRMPEYMDQSNEPWDEGEDLNAMNLKFGRRFKVVQFRWLAPNEIQN